MRGLHGPGRRPHLRVLPLTEGLRHPLPQEHAQIPLPLRLLHRPLLAELQEPPVPGGRHRRPRQDPRDLRQARGGQRGRACAVRSPARGGGGRHTRRFPQRCRRGTAPKRGGWGGSQEAAPSTSPSPCPAGAGGLSGWAGRAAKGREAPRPLLSPLRPRRVEAWGAAPGSGPTPCVRRQLGSSLAFPVHLRDGCRSVGLCAAGEETLPPRRCRCPGRAAGSAARHSCLNAWLLAGLKPRKPCLVFPFSTRSALGCTLAQSSSSWQADG